LIYSGAACSAALNQPAAPYGQKQENTMSAYVCPDEQIATIAISYHRLLTPDVQAPDVQARIQALADQLLGENIRSVNYRYRENAPVRACDLSKHSTGSITLGELIAYCDDLEYQSCECDDHEGTAAGKRLARVKALFQAAQAVAGNGTRPAKDVWAYPS
jgi:hypothetical protein